VLSVRDALFAFVLAALVSGPARAQVPAERNHDRAWKIELLEDSFQMAALARQPNRQKTIIGSRLVYRSRAEILSLAFDQRLDRLSLQARVVRQMFQLDKSKALDMLRPSSAVAEIMLTC
jgi:hypothetical protein